ncbi:MAG TPA: hypothetical protein DDW52_23475 [Planctomycetaceae bacterium]|nr:hypothetical protein [Planctomycetaceae bacterium]
MKKSWQKVLASTVALLVLVQLTAQTIHVAGSQSNPRQRLTAVRFEGGLVGRSVLQLEAGPCVILHFSDDAPDGFHVPDMCELSIETRSKLQQEFPLIQHSDHTTFNCVTFALAGTLPLGPNDWIDCFARDSTCYVDSARIAVESTCFHVEEQRGPEINWEALATSERLRNGDIVEYSVSSGPYTTILHMGRILKTDAGNELLSKFGRGPIVQSTLEAAGELYHATSVVIHRSRP